MTVNQGHTPAALAEMSKAAPQAPEPTRKCAAMSSFRLQMDCVATRTGDQPLNADTDSMDANGEGVDSTEVLAVVWSCGRAKPSRA